MINGTDYYTDTMKETGSLMIVTLKSKVKIKASGMSISSLDITANETWKYVNNDDPSLQSFECTYIVDGNKYNYDEIRKKLIEFENTL